MESNQKIGSFVSESSFLLTLTQEFVNFLFTKKEVLNYSLWIIFKNKTNLTVELFHPLCITLTAPKHAVKQLKRTKIVWP